MVFLTPPFTPPHTHQHLLQGHNNYFQMNCNNMPVKMCITSHKKKLSYHYKNVQSIPNFAKWSYCLHFFNLSLTVELYLDKSRCCCWKCRLIQMILYRTCTLSNLENEGIWKCVSMTHLVDLAPLLSSWCLLTLDSLIPENDFKNLHINNNHFTNHTYLVWRLF